MWTPADIAVLTEALDLRSLKGESAERWLLREFHAPFGECIDTVSDAIPAGAEVVGNWPASEHAGAPDAMIDALNRRLTAIQTNHSRAVGGPLESLGIAVGRVAGTWHVAIVL